MYWTQDSSRSLSSGSRPSPVGNHSFSLSSQNPPDEVKFDAQARDELDAVLAELSFPPRSGQPSSWPLRGFVNSGNSCFVNSVCQALVGCPRVVSELLGPCSDLWENLASVSSEAEQLRDQRLPFLTDFCRLAHTYASWSFSFLVWCCCSCFLLLYIYIYSCCCCCCIYI